MNANAILKSHLIQFWNQFGGKKNNGAGFTWAQKLTWIKSMSTIVIPFHHQSSLEKRREQFDEVKSKLHKFKRFGLCFACGKPAECRHHLIQLQNGGINSKKNVVSLCNPCHAEVHPWL